MFRQRTVLFSTQYIVLFQADRTKFNNILGWNQIHSLIQIKISQHLDGSVPTFDLYSPQMMNPSDFDDLMVFPLVPP